jgi:dGTPase
VEALALAHDLGHPPFGHSGEDVLNECLLGHGGFNHNAQALRICELLETSYREHPGLNLTREVLEGQQQRAAKHHSPTVATVEDGPIQSPLLEVQAVDAADSIAYDAHDADDSLELGLLEMNQLLDVPLWREAHQRAAERSTDRNEPQLRRAIVHQLIDWQVNDVIENSAYALAEGRINSVLEVRKSPPLIGPAAELAEKKASLEHFLFDNVYRHPQVLAKRWPAQQALRDSFNALVKDPKALPVKFRRLAEREGIPRAAADYLAGMTDRFALEVHRRLAAR